tara:strand:- start:475 stop:1605 length:1131 start_codon:yes stop_codon:yes gene_type:complete
MKINQRFDEEVGGDIPFTPPQNPLDVTPQGVPEFTPDEVGPNTIDPRLLYTDQAQGFLGINPDDFPGWAGGTITLENFEEFIQYLIGQGFGHTRADHPDNLTIEEIYAAVQAMLGNYENWNDFSITQMIMFLYYIGGPEGFSGTVYLDSRGNPTIGYGFTRNAEGLQEALDYINATYGTNYTIDGLFGGSQTLTRAHAGIILSLISVKYFSIVNKGLAKLGFTMDSRGLNMIFQILFSLVYQGGAGFFDKFPKMIKALLEGRFMDAWLQLIYVNGTPASGTTDWYEQTRANSPRFQMIYQLFYWLFIFYGITPDGPGVGQRPPIPGGEQVVRTTPDFVGDDDPGLDPDLFANLGESNNPLIESFKHFNNISHKGLR